MLSTENYKKIFQAFNQLKVLIIGDAMLDLYIRGKVDRISPEAPVPVVSVSKRETRLGGASNVALNVMSLGAEPLLCTVIGKDSKGDEFVRLMEEAQMDASGIIRSEHRITTVKSRIIGNNNQMLRVDEETDEELNMAEENELVEHVLEILEEGKTDIIIFEDYDKGCITPTVIEKICTKAVELNIPVAVDPKFRNFRNFKNITLFKPNLKELRDGLSAEVGSQLDDELKSSISYLHASQNIQVVLTTLSEKGVLISYRTVSNKIKFLHVPALVRSVADVSGAGDTLIGTAALCIALKLPPEQIAVISNLAGGLVCEEPGVKPVDKEKLLMELISLSQ
jgi:D-glycero-beta-D-manno-heptose-7-phosphate kinase